MPGSLADREIAHKNLTELIITEEYRDPIENELIINEITMPLPDPALDDG